MTMYKYLVVSVGLLSGLVCAQALPTLDAWQQDHIRGETVGTQQSRAQRQSDLRDTLRAQRTQSLVNDEVRGERQLTAQERKELRQQLRQLRHEGIRK